MHIPSKLLENMYFPLNYFGKAQEVGIPKKLKEKSRVDLTPRTKYYCNYLIYFSRELLYMPKKKKIRLYVF